MLATDFWSAKKGRDALEIAWDIEPSAKISTTGMREQYADLAKTPGLPAKKEGDVDVALARAFKQLSAEYEVPYLAHATMEPLNSTVDLKRDSCEIWTGTKSQTADRNAAAAVAGLKPEQVKVHTMYLGGGFGWRASSANDFVKEAVHVAKAAKAPIKVIWTREDDMRGGFYRPMWYDRIAAGLDEKGNPIAWKHTIVGQSIITGTAFEGAMVKDGSVEQSNFHNYPLLRFGEMPEVEVCTHGNLQNHRQPAPQSAGENHHTYMEGQTRPSQPLPL